jgi:hypothetical protein
MSDILHGDELGFHHGFSSGSPLIPDIRVILSDILYHRLSVKETEKSPLTSAQPYILAGVKRAT